MAWQSRLFSRHFYLLRHLFVCADAGERKDPCGRYSPAAPSPVSASVYVIDVSGEVDPGMAAFVDRALEGLSGNPDNLVIAEIDTFGGRVDSALEIVDTFLKIPPDQSIAFVKKKAISAGALIALSCGRLVMMPATTIGDCAPITYSQEGPEMLGEKFQSPSARNSGPLPNATAIP
ncbi:MAG: ATP-dependent Clp protease proteolytic subunit [Desulfobacterales bacterium]